MRAGNPAAQQCQSVVPGTFWVRGSNGMQSGQLQRRGFIIITLLGGPADERRSRLVEHIVSDGFHLSRRRAQSRDEHGPRRSQDTGALSRPWRRGAFRKSDRLPRKS